MLTTEQDARRIDDRPGAGGSIDRGHRAADRGLPPDRARRRLGGVAASGGGTARRRRRTPAILAVPEEADGPREYDDGLDPAFDEIGDLGAHLDGLAARMRPGWASAARADDGPGHD